MTYTPKEVYLLPPSSVLEQLKVSIIVQTIICGEELELLIAPRVEIEDDVLNFGNLLCGQSSTALLHVSNHSDVTALLQV